jgi:exodeoxyribonuclease VII small subunit
MATKAKRFEDELKDLETIVNQIDSGELTLEESIGAFERGVTLVKALNQKLDEVERKVEVLTRTAEGGLESARLDDDAGEPARRRTRPGKDEDEPPF